MSSDQSTLFHIFFFKIAALQSLLLACLQAIEYGSATLGMQIQQLDELFSQSTERERERVMKSIGKQEPVRWSLQYICRSTEINQCLLMRSDTEVRLDHSLCILGVEVYRGQRGVRGNPLIQRGNVLTTHIMVRRSHRVKHTQFVLLDNRTGFTPGL